MKTIYSKLFGQTVHIVGDYERKPEGTWFTEGEVKAMREWDDGAKKLFLRMKEVFGSETTVRG